MSLNMFIRPLTAELERIAERNLDEVSDRVPQDLEHIREWLWKQPHIKARMDAQWLIIFLRCCKFRLERTKDRLDAFYTARTLLPQFSSNRDPFRKEIQDILNARFIVVLPDTLHCTNPRKVLVTAENLNPDIHTLYNVWKTVSMVFDMFLVEEDSLSVNGVEVMIDFKHVSYKYLGQCTPTFLMNLASGIQKAYPVRIKKIIIINADPWYISLYNTFKHFVMGKIQERINFCNDHLDNVTNEYYFPNLVKEFCGQSVTWDDLALEIKAKLEKFQDWFLEDLQYGVDESKRPEKAKIEDFYGSVQGAFRKLTID